VILHVQGNRGARRGGGLGHPGDVGERDVVAARQRLAEGGELDGHLGADAEALRGQRVGQRQIRVPGAQRLGGVGDVLAQEIEGDLTATGVQRADGGEGVVQSLARHETVHHGTGDRRRGNGAAQRFAAGGGEKHGTQHGYLHGPGARSGTTG
jgi:hypothetical protein